MTNEEIIELTDKYVAATYGRQQVAFVSGSGARLTDGDGKEYLDFVTGVAACSLGHKHPNLIAAIKEQSEKLVHVSNHFYIQPQGELAKLLVENSFGDRVFFCNSGAEAVEAALKLARKYFSQSPDSNDGEKRYKVITTLMSFHGRTAAAMAATGQDKIHAGFEPILPGFNYVPFGDASAVREAIDDETAGVMVEPIQGEGGVIMPPKGYLEELRSICDEAGVLLILDEVQTGIGRTGKLFAYEHSGIKPDVMTLAKGLGGGVPIGAMVATEDVMAAFTPGSHGSTFGGNPLASAVAKAVVETILNEGVLENCKIAGEHLSGKLDDLKGKFSFIKEVRGRGLLLAMELDRPCAGIVAKCRDRGLLINCTVEKVLRFMPPLTVTTTEIHEAVDTLKGVLEESK